MEILKIREEVIYTFNFWNFAEYTHIIYMKGFKMHDDMAWFA